MRGAVHGRGLRSSVRDDQLGGLAPATAPPGCVRSEGACVCACACAHACVRLDAYALARLYFPTSLVETPHTKRAHSLRTTTAAAAPAAR